MSKHSLKPSTGGGIPLPRDVETLHVNGSASLAELKDFLGTLHGKSPQEVIGIVSTSLLFQSLGVAIVATIALLAVFTVGPYLIYGPPQAKEVAKKPAETVSADQPATATPADGTAAAGDAAQPDAEAAAKVMGIDEAKTADPGKNPLDKGPEIDNLLDGVP